MRRPTTPTKPIPKPLAAYRLGLLSHTLWMWHKLFWDMAGLEETLDGVPFAVVQLREARLVLSDEIGTNVFAAMGGVLDDLDGMANTLVEALRETGTYMGLEFGSPNVPGASHWKELRLLADRALAGDNPLRPWFDYGAAAGAYQLALHDYQPGPDDSAEQLPDIRPLVRQVRMLPEASMQEIPLLRSLVETAPLLERSGQGVFLKEFVARNREACGDFCDMVPIVTVNRMGIALDTRIQDGLIGLNPEPTIHNPTATDTDILTPREPTDNYGDSPLIPLAVNPQKPRWIKDRSELWVGEKRVRKVAEQATFIYILDQFESEGWPEKVNDTHDEGPDRERLRLALRSLNDGMSMLRFGRTRKGKGIYWEFKRPERPGG